MKYELVKAQLAAQPLCWLVTGAAGFIGSHLVEALLLLGQRVVGIDNFAGGHQRNLDQVQQGVGPARWAEFRFIRADVREIADCRQASTGVDIVLHHAALCSVPGSMDDPLLAHASNASGCMNMLVAARDSGVRRFVYATSSAIYGDQPSLPTTEAAPASPLSPYAATKYLNEIYAQVFTRCFGLECVGLRYFNVFGRRQDPEGAYAAVIPKWVTAMIRGQPLHINGDGETTRDFCHIENVVQANLLAATSVDAQTLNQVYNIAIGQRTTLNDLFVAIRDCLQKRFLHVAACVPAHREFRAGDVRHSLADIDKARRLLDYAPTLGVVEGLAESITWYADNCTSNRAPR